MKIYFHILLELNLILEIYKNVFMSSNQFQNIFMRILEAWRYFYGLKTISIICWILLFFFILSCSSHNPTISFLSYFLLPPFQIVGYFSKSRCIIFMMHLDIVFIQVHSKIYLSRFVKTTYTLKWREYSYSQSLGPNHKCPSRHLKNILLKTFS